MYSIFKFEKIFLFSLVIFFYSFIYYININLKFSFLVIKTLFPYLLLIFLFKYYVLKNNSFCKLFIYRTLPLTIFIIQLIILIYNPFFLDEAHPVFFSQIIKIPNYQQYFSYACFLILATYFLLSDNFFYKVISMITISLSSLHASSTSVQMLVIAFILIYFFSLKFFLFYCSLL